MELIIEIVFLLTLVFIAIAYLGLNLLYKNLKDEPNKSKLSGFEVARITTAKLCSDEPHIIKKKGRFLDHYNYERNVLKLSEEVFDGTNIYAEIVAYKVALETHPKYKKAPIGHKISSFLVISSYIMITIGAFINNGNVIHFGFILFILAFILELLIIGMYGNTIPEIAKNYELAQKEKLIIPFNENKNNLILIAIINIATLPYNFINYFR